MPRKTPSKKPQVSDAEIKSELSAEDLDKVAGGVVSKTPVTKPPIGIKQPL